MVLVKNGLKQPILLEKLEQFKNDSSFLSELKKVKQLNKQRLVSHIFQQTGIVVNEQSIFDVQVKRLHAYKRQLLNVLHILHLYNRMKEDSNYPTISSDIYIWSKGSTKLSVCEECY